MSAAVTAAPTAPAVSGTANGNHTRSLGRRSSKPVLAWLQRKLGSSSKAKKPHENVPPPRTNGVSQQQKNRVVSAPVSPQAKAVSQSANPPKQSVDSRKTVSLNEDDETRGDDVTTNSSGSSLARDSMWSPTIASADEDASMRPLPPSAPPSPSPSRDSSSYLSDPRTFKSVAISTKPTTLMSIDLTGGMAHIAQAPAVTPTTRLHPPHGRTNSTGTNAISFSALPPSTAPSVADTPPVSTSDLVQAPQHTSHHPRNNPRPSSPPLDNASMFTLASSAFAVRPAPLLSATANSSGPPSGVNVQVDGLSLSQAGSTYADAESAMGEDDLRDVDASVRALRPRSSRRGSWESEVSRWSAARPGAGTPISRSLWTGGSVKTGGFSAEGPGYDDDVSELTRDDTMDDGSPHVEEPAPAPAPAAVETKPTLPPTTSSNSVPTTTIEAPTPSEKSLTEATSQSPCKSKPGPIELPPPNSSVANGNGKPSPTGTETSGLDDVYHSAPSTPGPLSPALSTS